MGIDLNRVATKALETALEDGSSRRRGHTMRTLAAGAALAVGARAVMSNKLSVARHIPDLSKLRDVPDRVRDRMADAGWLDDEPDVDDDELEPEDEAGEDFDLEPDDEADEDFDEDEEEEPEDESDEDFDEDEEDFEDEPEDEDFDEDEEEEPEEESDEEDEPPELEIESEDDEDLHPEDRPPKPPRSKAKSGS